MLGNPWNPMPGWRFPGGLDEAMAPQNTIWNRGVLDAIGVPYAFEYKGEILRRVLRTNGEPGFIPDYLIRMAEASYGPDALPAIYAYLNDQFCYARNRTFLQPPAPFWSASPQCHPLWQSETWTLTCNANKPPGAVEGEPSEGEQAGWKTGDRPFPSFGNDLDRWSLYERKYPKFDAFNEPERYNLWQTYLPGDAESLPADMTRAGGFPFPELVLWGVANRFPEIVRRVYNSRAILKPVNI